MLPTLLAHAGAGAQWQALVVAIGVLTTALFLLVVFRVVKVKDHNDLVLPLAGVVIVSSLGTSQSDWLSDQVGWALPVGVVALVGLVVFALGPDRFTLRSPLFGGFVAAAAVAGLALQGPLTNVLHPPVDVIDLSDLPQVDDLEIAITQPGEQDSLTSPVTLVVDVTGGSVANVPLEGDDLPIDPEELGTIRLLDVAVGAPSQRLEVAPQESCSVQAPCTTLTYVLELAPGRHTLFAEFITAEGFTFLTPVFARVTIDVEDAQTP